MSPLISEIYCKIFFIMIYLSKSVPLFLAYILKPVFCSLLKKLEWQRILWILFACTCRSIILLPLSRQVYLFATLKKKIFRPKSMYTYLIHFLPAFFVCVNSSWAWTILRKENGVDSLQCALQARGAVLRFRIRRIHMFLGLPDPDPLVRDTDPDPSIIKQK